MIHFIVCEQDSRQREYLKNCLQKEYPDCEITSYQQGAQLMKEAHSIAHASILLMNTVLADGSGIELAQSLVTHCPSLIIIFISACLDQAAELFDFPHCYFIHQPKLEERLSVTLAKAIERLNSRRQRLCLPLKDRVVVLESKDVICLERNHRTSYVTSEDQVCSVSLNLEQLLAQLPQDFIICHRSYAVNLNKVEVYKRTEFIMKNGIHVPIGRSYASKVRRLFQAYMQRMVG